MGAHPAEIFPSNGLATGGELGADPRHAIIANPRFNGGRLLARELVTMTEDSPATVFFGKLVTADRRVDHVGGILFPSLGTVIDSSLYCTSLATQAISPESSPKSSVAA